MKTVMTAVNDDILAKVSGGTTAAFGEPKFVAGDAVYFVDDQLVVIYGTVKEICGTSAGEYLYAVTDRMGVTHIKSEKMLNFKTASTENGAHGGW